MYRSQSNLKKDVFKVIRYFQCDNKNQDFKGKSIRNIKDELERHRNKVLTNGKKDFVVTLPTNIRNSLLKLWTW